MAKSVNTAPIGGKSLFVSVLANRRPKTTREHRVAEALQLMHSRCEHRKLESGQKCSKHLKTGKGLDWDVHHPTNESLKILMNTQLVSRGWAAIMKQMHPALEKYMIKRD